MEVILAIILSLGAISFHELGHAYAMWRRGIPITRVSLIGIPLPFIPSLKVPVRLRPDHDPTPFEIHPFVIGAFAQPKEGTMEKLAPVEQAHIYGAGPHASYLYGCIMMVIYALLSGPDYLQTALLYGSIGIGLLLFYVWSCRYLVLASGVALLGFLVNAFINNPGEAASGVGGPVTIVDYGAQMMASESSPFAGAFIVAAFVSIALGTTNALPFVPFDGGHMTRVYLTASPWKSLAKYHLAGSLLAVIGILGLVLMNDIGKLF